MAPITGSQRASKGFEQRPEILQDHANQQPTMETIRTAITAAISNYHDFNPATIDELAEEPSPLEFMRYVSRNRPFVVRRAAANWTAVKKWDAEYLREKMGREEVQVTVTPLGNADAVVEDTNGQLLFVQPYETTEPFNEFLSYVQADSACPLEQREGRNVKYAQTQNDNLHTEYSTLLPDIPSSIPFARIALDQEADAINLWIGNARSTTALHKDNYENVYVQIRGQKHFVLLSPTEIPCVNEQPLPQAHYAPNGEKGELVIERDLEAEDLPFATWDPDAPTERMTRWSGLARPLRCTLGEGDVLYLPAMWYHKVLQTAGDEGFACAVNYWYDMEFAGGFWAANAFLRDVALAEERAVRGGGWRWVAASGDHESSDAG